jgi:hypothetical protein
VGSIDFIMAAEDEARFLSFVFERPTARLIPAVRNPTAKVPFTRDPHAGAHGAQAICALWDTAILPEPSVEYIESCDDYYLGSDGELIHYVRSQSQVGWKSAAFEGDALLEGSISLGQEWKFQGPDERGARQATRAWLNRLIRWLKANFTNSFVYASDYQPEVGHRHNTTWLGPAALALVASGWKLKLRGPPEFSLHYFDPRDEQATLARYRKHRQLLGEGRVVELGEVKSEQTRRRVYRVAFERGVPFQEFEGAFSCYGHEPKVGDSVACVFGENITGRHPEPWEPGELKKFTSKSRDKIIAQLKKSNRF